MLGVGWESERLGRAQNQKGAARRRRVMGMLGLLSLCSCAAPRAPELPQSGMAEAAARKPRTPAPTPVYPAWTEDFSGTALSSRWIVSSWPGFWQRNGITGQWDPAHVRLNGQGQLVLKLTVDACGTGFCARGAEIQSTSLQRYGRYSYRMRAASSSEDPQVPGQALSGTISGAFSYQTDSVTEIDVELESRLPTRATLGSWAGLSRHEYTEAEQGVALAGGWHDYVYEWRPDGVSFFVDGRAVWKATSAVPSQAAYVMLNVWPTNEAFWGGLAQTGARYLLVDRVSFEPF